ncbi:hypothetical protein Cgig2_003624 [Carnegiea gigantea]|uniref:Uncharacterized protein n=1 Tax=Carnegiea gigantea TaxID=171969 RepID=A0A9Q1K8B9_9CARY|nr:hypothetical protein Cgig2_003624 [Carnegiea gigantea]
MASTLQLESTSIFGRDRQRGISATDVKGGGNDNALLNFDENQSPTENAIVSHSPSDRTGNLSAPQILSPEGLTTKRYPVKSLEVSKATIELLILVRGKPQTISKASSGIYLGWDRYQGAPEHASLVKEEFYRKGQNRLKDLVFKVSKKKPDDPIPWLSPDIREQLIQHKKTSRGFLKRSRQAMLNKIIRPKVRSRHTLGLVSAAKIAKCLAVKGLLLGQRKAGETPTAAKLFAKAHEDDGHFLEAAGGWSEKGTIYGLGNAVEHFYKRPTAGKTSTKPSYTPSIVSQLQSELDSTKAMLNSTKNELQQQRQSVENH